ncbi:hypothetical protein ZWY2020_041157 [Hordeum vulgare]|nr:hypothetical protein ZWY2020_041157 [Hordeum vulgare]
MDRPTDEERPHHHCHDSATKQHRVLVKKETQIGTRDGWSSDLVWTQCKPCVECFNQSTPEFDPSSSSTYTALPCSSSLCSDLPSSKCTSGKCGYTYTYGDSSSTQGVVAAETFTLAKTKFRTPPAAASRAAAGSRSAGLVGLGPSLVSQLGLNKFSSASPPSATPAEPASWAPSPPTRRNGGASSVQTTPHRRTEPAVLLLREPQGPGRRLAHHLPSSALAWGGTRGHRGLRVHHVPRAPE